MLPIAIHEAANNSGIVTVKKFHDKYIAEA